jgi:hypothetical protein
MTNRTRIFHEFLTRDAATLHTISGIYWARLGNSKIAAEKPQAPRSSLEIFSASESVFSLGQKLCLRRGPGLSVNVKNQ